MNSNLQERFRKFEDIYMKLIKEYKWSSSSLICSFTSLIYTTSSKEFSSDRFEGLQTYIKENTGMFSHYRGSDKFFISALLDTTFDAPKENFIKLTDVEKKLSTYGFSKGSYAALASHCLLSSCDDELKLDERMKKGKLIYDGIKKKHFWLTGQDDYPLSMLLASSDNNTDSIINNIEILFDGLREAGFSRTNSLQFLSHILSFSNDSSSEKIRKCVAISEELKARKLKISSYYYGTLGLIALIYNNDNKMLDDIKEVVELLKGVKGLRWQGKDILTILAAAIVTSASIENYKQNEAVVQSTLGISVQMIIAAQTAATMAAVSAASAAAASASSSS